MSKRHSQPKALTGSHCQKQGDKPHPSHRRQKESQEQVTGHHNRGLENPLPWKTQ